MSEMKNIVESWRGYVNEQEQEPDEEQSGLYMVKKLSHYFDSKGSYTKLQLCRDTTGRKSK